MSLTVEGVPEMEARLNAKAREYIVKAKRAMESVLREMVNWIQNNHSSLGGWQNRSHNLEESIDCTDIFDCGDRLVGVIYAGPDYALYVEYTPGHWVISGALNEYRTKAMKLIAQRIKAQ